MFLFQRAFQKLFFLFIAFDSFHSFILLMIELGLAWVWVWVWLVLVDVDGAVGGVNNVWVVKRLIWKIIKICFFVLFIEWMNEWTVIQLNWTESELMMSWVSLTLALC